MLKTVTRPTYDPGPVATDAPVYEIIPCKYGQQKFSAKAIGATALIHVGVAALLIGLSVSGQHRENDKRLAVFDVSSPTPPVPAPPPPQPQQVVTAQSPTPAQVIAPNTLIPLSSQVVASSPTPVELHPVAAPVEAPPAPPAPPSPPASITPPDFSASQLNNPGPEYPFQSRVNHEEGTAMLRVLVTPEGRAGEVKLERSSGYSRLDRAALKVVRHWRFVPAKQAGFAVAAWVLVPIGFSLGK